MNCVSRFFRTSLLFIIVIVLSLSNALAAKLTIPSGVKEIEEEAFYGDNSIDEVVLPEGIERIGARAFAESSLTRINLPDSLVSIGENALGTNTSITVTATEGSDAYNWAVQNGYIEDETIGEPADGIWGTCAWDLSEDGILTIHSGTGVNTQGTSPWFGFRKQIKSIVSDGMVVLPADSSSLFDGFQNCTSIQIYSFNTNNVINMHAMFRGCAATHWSMSSFSTSKVTDMSSMFENCTNLTYQAFYSFDTSSVQDMNRMFASCGKMTGVSNIEKLDTSSVTNMSGMFSNCTSLTTLNLTTFDTSSVRDMSEMFSGCSNLCSLSLNGLDTSNVLNFNKMFNNCSGLLRLDLSSFNTKEAQYMTDMFSGCSAMNSITLGVDFTFKGKGVDILTTLPLRNWYSALANTSFTEQYIAENRNGIADTYNIFGIDDGFYYRIDNDTYCTVMGYYGDALEIIIPKKAPDGHIVNQIGDNAFNNRNDLSGTIIIPETITTIGNNAFNCCYGFTGNLIIPGSVQTIGNRAFYGCTGLKGTLVIQPGVKQIGEYAFSGSGFTGDLVIPGSIQTIGMYAFNQDTGFNGTLIIQSGVESIGYSAFGSCTNFHGDLILPNSVVSLDEHAFEKIGCDGNLTISSGLTKIPKYCFAEAKMTGDLIIPEGITDIEYYAFYDGAYTGHLVLPSTLKNVNGFTKCKFTGSLNLPDGLQTIQAGAFDCCSGFTGDLIIPDSVTLVSGWAFADCRGFNGHLVLSNSLTIIEGCSFYRCWGLTGDLIIPDGVTEIHRYAFSDCWGFNGALSLPLSLNIIEERAFQLCNQLTGDLIIPDGVTKIEDAAFAGCRRLNSMVYIPDTVTDVTGTPFSATQYYRTMSLLPTLSYSYASSMISTSALSSKVSKFILKKNSYSHLHAEEHGFTPYELEYIDASGVLRSGEGWVLRWRIENGLGTDGVTHHTLLAIYLDGANATDGTIFTYSSTGNGYDFPWLSEEYGYSKSDFSLITITGTATNPLYIIADMFKDYDNVRQVSTDYVYGFGGSAFENCTSLKRVNGFDAVLVSIGDKAFKNCTQLADVSYSRSGNNGTVWTQDPVSLVSIGNEAFRNTALEGITLYSSVTTIADNAFSGCDELTIYCEKDSIAHSYAVDHNIPFMFINISSSLFNKNVDSWGFSNSYTYFGSGETHYITSADRERLFANISRTARADIESYINETWSGSCYGMSSTTVLVKMGVISPSSIQGGKENLHDISKTNNDSVESFINYYHMQQLLPGPENDSIRFRSMSRSQQLARIKALAQSANETGIPFILSFALGAGGGHAVVGYGFESGEYNIGGAQYNSKVLIYDCSNPTYESALYFNDGSTDFALTCPGGTYGIAYFRRAHNSRYLLDAVHSGMENEGYFPHLTYDDLDFTLQYHGENVIVSSGLNDASKGLVVSSFEAGASNVRRLYFTKDDSDFAIIPAGKAEFSYYSDNGLYNLDVDSASLLSFNDGEVGLSGVSGDYEVELIVDDHIGSTAWYNASISGSDNDISIRETAEGLILEGEDLNGITVSVRDDQGLHTEELETDNDLVLLTSDAGSDIVIMIDTDDDGNFDQILSDDEANKCGDNAYWNLSNDGILTISGSGAMWDYTVYEDGRAPWKIYEQSIRSVVVEDGISYIGDCAFHTCFNITSVQLPNSLRRIGDMSFLNCSGIEEIELPQGLEEIGDSSFSMAIMLRSIVIPDTVTTIGDYAFSWCHYLETATIPSGVTSIGTGAFSGCPSIYISIDASNPNYRTQNGALYNKEGDLLISFGGRNAGIIAMPSTVEVVGDIAFADNQLSEIVFTNGLTTIQVQAFQGCSEMTKITLPASLSLINDYAFAECQNLTDVYFMGTAEQWNAITISESGNAYLLGANIHFLDDISSCIAQGGCGENLSWILYSNGMLVISGTGSMNDYLNSSDAPWFRYRYNITSIIIEDGPTSIGNMAFNGCDNLANISISESVASIGNYAISCGDGLTELVIPDSVVTIGNYAVMADELTSIVLPKNLTTIGQRPFWRCSKLRRITISEENALFRTIDGVLYSKNNVPGDYLLIYPCGSERSEFAIPDGVFGIGKYAFEDCQNLTNVVISDTVCIIGSNAFQNCNNITSFTLPESVFAIEYGAFSFCGSLKHFYVSPDNEKYEARNGVLFDKENEWIVCYPCANPATGYVIPNGTVSIDSYAFANCENLRSIVIPDTVSNMYSDAFMNCVNLKSIAIPEGINTIRGAVFRNCTSLESVSIPLSVTEINGSAFSRCNAITDVYYAGTSLQWESIDIIEYGNETILNANLHFETASPGWHSENGKTYYYDNQGNLLVGWQHIDYHWYYFKPDGEMLIGSMDDSGNSVIYAEGDGEDRWVFLSFQFKENGQYNLFDGWFEADFMWQDDDSWQGSPQVITLFGDSKSARSLMLWFEEEGTGEGEITTVNGERINFGFVWTLQEDGLIITVGTDEWLFSQYEGSFSIIIDNALIEMSHGMGWG